MSFTSTLTNYEILEKIVQLRLDASNKRIKKELQIIQEAPDFIAKSFIAGYQYCVIDNNEPSEINDCNSLIAYQLGITKQPPNRDSLHYPVKPADFPDIDLDFAYPDDIKEYIKNKYGEDKTCAIGTVGKYKFKALLGELCRFIVDENGRRVVPLDEVNDLNKKLHKIDQQYKPDEDSDDEEDLFTNQDILTFQKKYPGVFTHFKALYALPKFRGKHAAGILILNEKARDVLPLSISAGHVTTEYSEGQGSGELSSIGAIKIDILGLKTLKMLDSCNKLIMNRYPIDEQTPSPCACKKEGKECPANYLLPLAVREATGEKLIDFNKICLNIPKIYKAIGNLETHGIFQFEPEGISAFSKRYGPKQFEDLAIISALFRPGPLDLKLDEAGLPIDESDSRYNTASSAAEVFIERYNGRVPVTFPSPRLESVLSKTLGVCVYQELLVKSIMAATGESFVEADKLRKYFSKAKPKYYSEDAIKMAELKRYEEEFKLKALKNGCSEKEADDIWRLILPFGSYGFNQGHATAYAMITYQTAFCLTHFPLEWFTALLIHNTDNANQEKLMEYFYSAQNYGITVLPPDINKSNTDFAIDESDNIVAGLSLVKGVGEKACKVLTDERDKNGPFTSIEDLLSRQISWTQVKVNILQNLAMVGVFDSISPNRALTMIKIALNKKKVKLTDKSFEIENRTINFDVNEKEPIVTDFSDEDKKDMECELTNLNFRNPFFKNKAKILADYADYLDSMVCGIISEIVVHEKKAGGYFARFTIFNLFKNKFEQWLYFGKKEYKLSNWTAFQKQLKPQTTLMAKGKISKGAFIVDSFTTL